MTRPFGDYPFLGDHPTIADALERAQLNRWDANGDGSGYFAPGTYFFHTAQEQFYRAYGGSIWGDKYTLDEDLQQLNWTSTAGNGVITDAVGYTGFSLAVSGTDCTLPTNAPRKTIPMPPWDFLMTVHVLHNDVVVEQYKNAWFGIRNNTDPTKNIYLDFYRDNTNLWVLHQINDGAGGFTAHGQTTRWLSISHRTNPGSNYWSWHHAATMAAPPDEYHLTSATLHNAGIIDGVSRQEDNVIMCAGSNSPGAGVKAFDAQFSYFQLWRL